MTSLTRPDTAQARPRLLGAPLLRLLAVATAACLAVDAWVHLRDASDYEAVRTSVLSQGTLFRIEGVVAIVVAVALVAWPRRAIWAAAVVVLGSALGAVVLYTYVDVGQIGPLPNMYEPIWQLPGKLASAWAEGIGLVAAVAGLVLVLTTARARRTS